MNVLVIGSGAREHALAWKLSKSPTVKKLYCLPGNAGTAAVAENLPGSVDDLAAIVRTAKERAIELVVVGPEDPLVRGLVGGAGHVVLPQLLAVGHPIGDERPALAAVEGLGEEDLPLPDDGRGVGPFGQVDLPDDVLVGCPLAGQVFGSVAVLPLAAPGLPVAREGKLPE